MTIDDSPCRHCWLLPSEHVPQSLTNTKCPLQPTVYEPLTSKEVGCAITQFDGRLGVLNWWRTRFGGYLGNSRTQVIVALDGRFQSGGATVTDIEFAIPLSDFRFMAEELTRDL